MFWAWRRTLDECADVFNSELVVFWKLSCAWFGVRKYFIELATSVLAACAGTT
jgi:hypothetical protein